MADGVFHSRSRGVGAEGIPDQYADGKAAKLWEVYIGEKNDRTKHYREFLTGKLRDLGIAHVLDVACGTGIDSIMLLEEGFRVTSTDASDRMLKYALKTRWNRRKDPVFDGWVIEEGNWLTLPEDIVKPENGFDAVICLGNSFSHLPDVHKDGQTHARAIRNFWEMMKPGGYLIIDHRNYDYILDEGKTPPNSIYYNSKHIKSIETGVLFLNNKPYQVTLDYHMDVSDLTDKFDRQTDTEFTKKGRYDGELSSFFRLSYFPHRLRDFDAMLIQVFGEGVLHETYGDFQPLEVITDPTFYIHIIQKKF
ncbi:glycine N-methyltransferase-like [Tropilaelaps mercedesae]|uniref:Glycine N-methyltransferase n=1 Tax=Tropilaelaps mercedesae TaxID=418985 RepID=A0A1V9XIB1_9ACAR|nr:glycine N-methyltransferase-like [Tropilaelaps mercedesae]